MGLKCNAKNGVKAQLRERFPSAFRKFETLVDARNASSASREEAFACIDGNVLMMAVPQNCRTFDAYVAIVYSSLLRAIATAMVTIVVFDDPSAMTEAKLDEQRRRDSARASTSVLCSSDISAPKDDDYTKEYMVNSDDVHALKSCRGTRMRFFDEVAMTVMDRLKLQISKWEKSGHAGGYVVMDGIDSRGASRGMSDTRVPGFVSSSIGLAEIFQRGTKIGEGDLKLAALGRRVRELSNEGVEYETTEQKDHAERLKCTKLTMCTTIDTDSFAIELIEEARRSAEPTSPANTLLCMRERAKKRDRDDDCESHYLCCDVSLLHASLQKHMWGVSRNPEPIEQRSAISLLVAGWSICGCDFVEIKGMRSDVVFDAISEVVKTRGDSLAKMQHAWKGDRSALTLMHQPLRDLMMICGTRLLDIKSSKKMDTIDNVRQPDEIVLNRVSWIVAYWNSCEFRGNMQEFGFASNHSD
jgi:hypothetical protein